ncbi:peptidoglycan DD-metalloendopeptidase family protein [bacterium]|nr:peptidoglycan DD-metalloendopeptidase family protein [bacterium]
MQDFKDTPARGSAEGPARTPAGRRQKIRRYATVLAASLAALYTLNLYFDPSPEIQFDNSDLDSSGGPHAARDSSSIIRWLVEPISTLDKVRVGDTFETLLRRNGIDYDRMLQMIQCARPLYNLNRVVVGREIKFIFQNEKLAALEYEIDPDRTLRLTCADTMAEVDWNAELVETEYQVREREVSGTIENSLYQSVVDVAGQPELAMRLSEIFAWQIDFHSDVQKGDRFKLIYEEKVHPKGTAKVGEIFAAVYQSAGRDFYAIRYTNKDGSQDYFDLDGLSMRRKFLKSPFKYMPRISSRFTYSRFHPILKIRRPHLGVDYAAPAGTPVLALGDGRVTFSGRKGGFGNFILLKHNGMYATGYGHLQKILVHSGTTVRQGQVIGLVGSTGLATGPHLDFRFFRNGTPVDPLKVDIPNGDPIDKSVLSAYKSHRDEMVHRMDHIGSPYGPPEPSLAAGPANSAAAGASKLEDE